MPKIKNQQKRRNPMQLAKSKKPLPGGLNKKLRQQILARRMQSARIKRGMAPEIDRLITRLVKAGKKFRKIKPDPRLENLADEVLKKVQAEKKK